MTRSLKAILLLTALFMATGTAVAAEQNAGVRLKIVPEYQVVNAGDTLRVGAVVNNYTRTDHFVIVKANLAPVAKSIPIPPATAWERSARLRPPGSATPGLLYWAGRAHLARGELDRARWLLLETVQRFKHSYHGLRARGQLARMGITPAAPPSPPHGRETSAADPAPDPRAERLRQLLLIDRLDEAAIELRHMGASPRIRATLAWIEWRRSRFRPAVHIMRDAFPQWVSAPATTSRARSGRSSTPFPMRRS